MPVLATERETQAFQTGSEVTLQIQPLSAPHRSIPQPYTSKVSWACVCKS